MISLGRHKNEYVIKGELLLFIAQYGVYAFLKHGSFVQFRLDLNMTTIVDDTVHIVNILHPLCDVTSEV